MAPGGATTLLGMTRSFSVLMAASDGLAEDALGSPDGAAPILRVTNPRARVVLTMFTIVIWEHLNNTWALDWRNHNPASVYRSVSDLPCNIRREGGQSLVIGGPSLVILEGKECNPFEVIPLFAELFLPHHGVPVRLRAERHRPDGGAELDPDDAVQAARGAVAPPQRDLGLDFRVQLRE